MYYECNVCHAHVDAGELVGGVCEDCISGETERRKLSEEMERMVQSTDFKQLEMEELFKCMTT